MQVWTSAPPPSAPFDVARVEVERYRDEAFKAIGAVAAALGACRTTRVRRVTIVSGPGYQPQDAVVLFAVPRPHLVVVFPDAHAVGACLRALLPEMREALRGRVLTAEQVSQAFHRGMPYAGLVVTDWHELTERQRVAVEADLRPLVAIGIRDR